MNFIQSLQIYNNLFSTILVANNKLEYNIASISWGTDDVCALGVRCALFLASEGCSGRPDYQYIVNTINNRKCSSKLYRVLTPTSLGGF
jgi:hypothetical protein